MSQGKTSPAAKGGRTGGGTGAAEPRLHPAKDKGTGRTGGGLRKERSGHQCPRGPRLPPRLPGEGRQQRRGQQTGRGSPCTRLTAVRGGTGARRSASGTAVTHTRVRAVAESSARGRRHVTERKTSMDPGLQKTRPSPGATFTTAPTARTALRLRPVPTQRRKERGPLQRQRTSDLRVKAGGLNPPAVTESRGAQHPGPRHCRRTWGRRAYGRPLVKRGRGHRHGNL